MRPHTAAPRRLLTISRRLRYTKAKQLPSWRLAPDEPVPFVPSALDAPSKQREHVPEVPLHLDALSNHRLNFPSRTINKGRMTEEDEATLETAMKRTQLPSRATVSFTTVDSGASLQRQDWFAGEEGLDGEVDAADAIPGIEPGRVVEMRRGQNRHIVLVLATVTINGRNRLLILRATGEIWPASPTDVTFVMPVSLMPAHVGGRCWSPELLQLWASGKDIGMTTQGAEEELIGIEKANDMVAARREAATVLRRVEREGERMVARLTSGAVQAGRGGGARMVWEHFVPNDDPHARGCVSAVEVAEFLLNASSTPKDKRITVRPHTLPAFAAQTLLMERVDLFVADEHMMWESGNRFLVRSRAENERVERVKFAVENNTPKFKAFLEKTAEVREAIHRGDKDLPAWNDDDLDIIWMLLLPIVETRSIQIILPTATCMMIVKAYESHNNIKRERTALGAHVTTSLLSDIGMLPVGSTLRTSVLREQADRRMALAGIRPEVILPTVDIDKPTTADTALDSLREEVSHRVFVIDDESAKELDDGIAVERLSNDQFWVHVHIADPTRYLSPHHPISVDASFMGTSLYHPDGTVPLLPRALGGANLSLGESDAPQPVMIFSARVDKDGNIHDYKVALGSLKSAVVTTYSAVNKALGIVTQSTTHPLGVLARDRITPSSSRKYTGLTSSDVSDLQLLTDLANAIRAKRYATAGFEWRTPAGIGAPAGVPPPVRNIFDRSTLPSIPTAYPPLRMTFDVHHPPPTVSSQNTVAEMAVLANRVAAMFCTERGVAVPFRGSSAPKMTTHTPAHLTVDKLLAGREKDSGLISKYDVMAAALARSDVTLSATSIPHWLMGLDKADQGYVRATSPLRRWEDMLVHWQIKATLAADAKLSETGNTALAADNMLALAKRAELGAGRAKTNAKVALNHWAARVLLDRATGPLPDGYLKSDEMIDLCNMAGTVASTISTIGPLVRVPVTVDALGLDVDLSFPIDDLRVKDLVIGAGVRIALNAETTRLWPNPVLDARPVTTEISPPSSGLIARN